MAAKKPATKGADAQAAKPPYCDFFIVVLGNFWVIHSLGRRYQGRCHIPIAVVFF